MTTANTPGPRGDCRETLAVVIPCYNAGGGLREVVAGARACVNRVIVVDDGSTDGAPDALADAGARLIRFPANRGKGAAILAGLRAALEEPAVRAAAVLDADGQHDPAELPKLYAAFETERADLVVGARVFGGREVPWASWLGNVLTRLLTRLFLGQSIPDTQSGYRVHGRRFAEAVVEAVGPGRYETEMEILALALRDGYKVVSTPIQTIYERGNPSSHFRKFRDSWRVWRALFQAARAQPRGAG